MKAVSIIQPWATLIALEEKFYETRSWRTKYKGEIAIHSSKKIDRKACEKLPISQALKKHGYCYENLPTGVIIATCCLDECLEVTEDNGDSARLSDKHDLISGNEYAFGDFGEGRFAWKLSNAKMLNKYIPLKGQLGLWNLKK